METTQTTERTANSPMTNIIKVLVALTITSVAVVMSTSLTLFFVKPPDGSSLEEILGGATAAFGILAAIFGSASIATIFRWRRWSGMPVWIRVYTGALLAFVIANWIYDIVS